LNVLAPDDLPTGIIGVEVETPSGTARTSADVRSIAPALFRSNGAYAAAVHQDGTLVGNPSVIPGARLARAGNIISLYGTGFGPTMPPRPTGELLNPAALATPYILRINGDRVSSSFGGIVGPGLYQFNFTMPNQTVASVGFAFIEIEIAGQRTDSQMILAVGR
jgi:uncharacterized protein (TIGR03437 family)